MLVGPVEVLYSESHLWFNLGFTGTENKQQANQNLGWYDVISDMSTASLPEFCT